MTHTHKLTGQQLQVKKQIGTSLFSDIIICLSENIIKNESKQLKLC